MLLVREARILEILEHEEVGENEEGQNHGVLHSFKSIMKDSQHNHRLEDISQTCTRAKSSDELLRNSLDVANDGGFAD